MRVLLLFYCVGCTHCNNQNLLLMGKIGTGTTESIIELCLIN